MKNAGLDAEFGSAQNSGLVRVYDGIQPAGPATAITSQVIRGTCAIIGHYV